uniref:ABC transmembrane type-1 domain-containing protein n=2 Tax=Oryza TaxID=4527 RepID=A0A0E0QXX8_ORYRU
MFVGRPASSPRRSPTSPASAFSAPWRCSRWPASPYVAFVWANDGEIRQRVDQDADIAAEAGANARWTILSLVQSVVVPVMASSAATAICHVAVC